MGQISLAPEQLSAELFLQQLDGARQGWLRDMALLGGVGKIPRRADREEVLYLIHLHNQLPQCARALIFWLRRLASDSWWLSA